MAKQKVLSDVIRLPKDFTDLVSTKLTYCVGNIVP